MEPESMDGGIRISTKEQQRRRARRRLSHFLILLGATLLMGLISFLLLKNYTDNQIQLANRNLASQTDQFSNLERLLNKRNGLRRLYLDSLPHLFEAAPSKELLLEGDGGSNTTAFLLDDRGTLVTPSRLLEKSAEVYLKNPAQSNEAIIAGSVIGQDKASGLAILHVPALEGRKPLAMATEKPDILESLLAVAITDGDQANVSLGSVHSDVAHHTIFTAPNPVKVAAFLTDITSYRGNDGAVILDLDGEIQGILSWGLTQRLKLGSNSAILPMEEILVIADRLKNNTAPVGLKLGVEGIYLKEANLPYHGFYIREVVQNSSAHRAKLRPTDMIISLDGVRVTETFHPDAILRDRQIGDAVKITIYRDGKLQEMVIKLY